MKAYLIDTPEHLIREVECDGEIQSIYDLLGYECTQFKTIMLNGRRDCLYVDEEALLKAQTNYDLRMVLFSHKRYHNTLIGRGLVLGTDEFGDPQSPFITINQLAQEITFYVQT